MIYQLMNFLDFKNQSFVAIDSNTLRISRIKNSGGVVSPNYLHIKCHTRIKNPITSSSMYITIDRPMRFLSNTGLIERHKRVTMGMPSIIEEDSLYYPIEEILMSKIIEEIEELALKTAYDEIFKKRNEFCMKLLEDIVTPEAVVNDTLGIEDKENFDSIEIFNTYKPEKEVDSNE
ncbi:hypothetical protein [Clostridium botulinum]|uniref:Uncharacterized protein n=3 Tax=Clostridium botulinum TaxID=1491 RepID=A0A9Q1UZ35_CLOBO|nr:hypothetical protein [Clostridium botulinum]KEI02435.1 hypothetical protein Z953_07360 [Clostridium botulinum D str. 16868]KLU75732.1 hypothetical protein CBC3_07230 [Clostridium botulinum V891]KEI04095.1 hypothetical protein Y848_02855 [Clostridium botulinum C/D str. Sp77]KOA74817.1 hypothetical protein ADU78_09915 [Clostridium botulinum]KOA76351.1 hypothetical protein ADU77_09380 [Clostridium botulinum]